MKQVFSTASLLGALLLLFSNACQQEENPTPKTGNVSFSFTQTTPANVQVVPAFVLLSVRSANGNLTEDIKLSLSHFAQIFTSEPLQLPVGNYQLFQFIVIDNLNRVIYAAPIKGSVKATQVALPLLIEFIIDQDATDQVVPQVLAVSSNDNPEDFGYVNFDAEAPGRSSEILVKTNVKLEIGGILYENVDAQIRVNGYDNYNVLQWTNDFSFKGPSDNVFAVPNGLHHYSIELLDKWGIQDIQSEILAETLWDGRADGPLPVTYTLAGSKDAKKLSHYVTYVDVAGSDGSLTYKPDSKVLYNYDASGLLKRIEYEYYNSQTSSFEESRYDDFTYDGAAVSKITSYLDGKLYTESLYEYGIENKITLVMYYNRGLVLTQTSSANEENNRITANYKLSDGNSFTYEFDVLYKNIIDDMNSQHGQLCNKGIYTYDKNINPLRHLGFMDFNFQNWSIGNKVTEDIRYFACGFPSLIPVSHSYFYDEDGYPLKKITTYKTGSFEGESNSVSTHRIETEYFYQE